MSINFSDLSRGLVIELDGQPWEVMEYERHKMQQRAPVTSIKMRNLLSGARHCGKNGYQPPDEARSPDELVASNRLLIGQ